MLATLIQSLVLAAAGLLSVGSITLVILLLLSEQGLQKGVAYMLGYAGAYMVIGVMVTLVGYRVAAGHSGESGNVVPVVTIALGLLLVWLAQRNWRKPPSTADENPRLFALLDKITPRKALGFGALVTVVNVKNLALFLTAVSVSLVSDLPLAAKIAIVVLVALVFCASVIVPVLIYILFPRRADRVLSLVKHTIGAYRRPIGIWAPLLFGVLFLMRGMTNL